MTPKTFPIDVDTYNRLVEENAKLKHALRFMVDFYAPEPGVHPVPFVYEMAVKALTDTKGAEQSWRVR